MSILERPISRVIGSPVSDIISSPESGVIVSPSKGNDQYTILLIHSDHSNGSVVFEDSSAYNHSLSILAGMSHTSAQAKFGISSLDANSGKYILIDSTNFRVGTSDLTLDLWFWPPTIHATLAVVFSYYSAVAITFHPDGHLLYSIGSTSWACGTPTLNAWNHLAVVRSSGFQYFYLNGVATDGPRANVVNINDTYNVAIGANRTGGDPGFGYQDEIRFSNVARWTENFTPPTEPYS